MTSTENIFTKKDLTPQECIKAFDKNGKNQLDQQNFKELCQNLFCNTQGIKYKLNDAKIREIFTTFDKNNDSVIDKKEFQYCWDKWINTILHPKSAILIIDVQNDFITGTLSVSKCPAKHNGADVIPPINALLENVKFDAVFYSLDWHPQNHISFIDNVKLRDVHLSSPIKQSDAKVFDEVIFSGSPNIVQKLWPAHCVQNNWGADLHQDLKVTTNAIKIYKGSNPDVDSYSAFHDNQRISETTLHQQMQAVKITDVYLCGLAWDYCVGHSALHALEHGYRTLVLEDCLRSLDLSDAEKMKEKIVKNNGVVINSDRVNELICGKDRLPELGYHLAMTLKNTAQLLH